MLPHVYKRAGEYPTLPLHNNSLFLMTIIPSFRLTVCLAAATCGLAHADTLASYLDGTDSLASNRTPSGLQAGVITPMSASSGELSMHFEFKFFPEIPGAPENPDGEYYWLTLPSTETTGLGMSQPGAASNSFSLTADAGSVMNLTSLSFQLAGVDTTPTRAANAFGYALWYETGDGQWQKIEERLLYAFTAQQIITDQVTVDLSGIAALQGLDYVNFALSALTQAPDPSGETHAVAFGGITVDGEVVTNAIPEPASFTLGLAALAALLRRRK